MWMLHVMFIWNYYIWIYLALGCLSHFLDEAYEAVQVSVPLHVSLEVSRHSATCHLWVCTTKMEKGIWHTGQKSPEEGPSAARSVCTECVFDCEGGLRPSVSPTAPQSPLSAVLTSLSGGLTGTDASLLEAFLVVHLLFVTAALAAGDACLFFRFSRGLYSQMSFSESSWCDIWS